MGSAQDYGKESERVAARFLSDLGYTIVQRRFRTRHGEIDIIALDGDHLVFVEVKARKHRLAEPEMSVGPKKLKALTYAAHAYLAELGEPERGFRLDLLVVHGDEIRHHRDLFGL